VKLKNKVVLISGASRGIGAEVARQAVGRGARVGLLARSGADLARLQAELGSSAASATADVLDVEQLQTAVASVADALGPIDVVVANAGIGLYGTFLDAKVEDLARVMETNYLGTVHLLKAVLPAMVERRQGHVAIVGSIAGRIGSPFEAGYSASKFAQTALAEALSVELAPHGIGVSLVSPGPVSTSFFEARGHAYDRPRPKPATAAKAAQVILDAVEHDKPDVFVSGFMHQALISKTLFPPLFRWGTSRAFAKELSAIRPGSTPSAD
jgi:short-subunit dehydrogenase